MRKKQAPLLGWLWSSILLWLMASITFLLLNFGGPSLLLSYSHWSLPLPCVTLSFSWFSGSFAVCCRVGPRVYSVLSHWGSWNFASLEFLWLLCNWIERVNQHLIILTVFMEKFVHSNHNVITDFAFSMNIFPLSDTEIIYYSQCLCIILTEMQWAMSSFKVAQFSPYSLKTRISPLPFCPITFDYQWTHLNCQLSQSLGVQPGMIRLI